MEKQKSLVERVSAFFSGLWQLLKEVFTKENLKEIKADCISGLKEGLKKAFDKKFFKACLIVLICAVLCVISWIAFAYSFRLGAWILALILITAVLYGLSKEEEEDHPFLFVLKGIICLMAIYCICFYLGSWIGNLCHIAPDMHETTALFGFLWLLLFTIIIIGLYAIYASTNKIPKYEIRFVGFVFWLIKWAFVIAAVGAICWFILKTALPLVKQ